MHGVQIASLESTPFTGDRYWIFQVLVMLQMTPQWKYVHTRHVDYPPEPITVEWCKGQFVLISWTQGISGWVPSASRVPFWGTNSQPFHPLSPAQFPNSLTELGFSEVKAPLVCEHSDLLIPDRW